MTTEKLIQAVVFWNDCQKVAHRVYTENLLESIDSQIREYHDELIKIASRYYVLSTYCQIRLGTAVSNLNKHVNK
jgi:hypothetical protein